MQQWIWYQDLPFWKLLQDSSCVITGETALYWYLGVPNSDTDHIYIWCRHQHQHHCMSLISSFNKYCIKNNFIYSPDYSSLKNRFICWYHKITKQKLFLFLDGFPINNTGIDVTAFSVYAGNSPCSFNVCDFSFPLLLRIHCGIMNIQCLENKSVLGITLLAFRLFKHGFVFQERKVLIDDIVHHCLTAFFPLYSFDHLFSSSLTVILQLWKETQQISCRFGKDLHSFIDLLVRVRIWWKLVTIDNLSGSDIVLAQKQILKDRYAILLPSFWKNRLETYSINSIPIPKL